MAFIQRRGLGRPATWDDLEGLPDDVIGEIVGGELLVTPRPDLPHIETASDLGGLLTSWFRFGIGGPGGWVILHEPRVLFGEDIRVPDLGGWRRERWLDPPRRGPLPIIPDWVCEVLSPSTEAEDRTAKMSLYARHEVRHLWLVHPTARTLEIYRLEQAGWLVVATHAEGERVRAEPFDAVELDLSMLWGARG